MGDAQKIKPPEFKQPKMVKLTVGDKSFETFITGHEVDQGALGRYEVKVSFLARNDAELLAMGEVLSPAIWLEPIEKEGS